MGRTFFHTVFDDLLSEHKNSMLKDLLSHKVFTHGVEFPYLPFVAEGSFFYLSHVILERYQFTLQFLDSIAKNGASFLAFLTFKF